MSLKITNTFGGLNSDLSVNKYPNDKYIDAKNLRVITNSTLESGALTNIPQPLETAVVSAGGPGQVVGVCNVRDVIVIFYVNTSTADSLIFKSNSTKTAISLVYSDSASTSKLNFNPANPIRAIGRYESEDLQKVYWCDGNNVNRFINIEEDHTGKEAFQFSLSPNADLRSPIPQNTLSGGTLESGIVYYTYQLYNLNGAQTIMSPSSFGIPLTSRESDVLKDFRGDEAGVDTGLSVEVYFNNIDTTFNRIKIYSIHFSDINADPSIDLIADQGIGSSTLLFVDSGTISLEALTSEEFLMLGGVIFASKTLETKKNYLFAGNITEATREIDFDARAYRFDVTGSSGSWSNITTLSDPSSPLIITNPLDPVPDDHDATNNFNNYDNDFYNYYSTGRQSGANFMYKYINPSDTGNPTLGGSGPNIEYEFITQYIAGNERSPRTNDVRNINSSYVSSSFLNPINCGKYRGYKRNEVYRFGLEFLFKNGQKSFVKWIGDVRTPHVNDDRPTSSSYFNFLALEDVVDVTYSLQLGIRMSIDLSGVDLSEVSGFRIVRAIREESDKNIISQGLIGALVARGGTPDYSPNLRFSFIDEIGATVNGLTASNTSSASGLNDFPDPVSGDLFEYISPKHTLNTGSNYNYNPNDKFYVTPLFYDNYVEAPGSYSVYQKTSNFSRALSDTNGTLGEAYYIFDVDDGSTFDANYDPATTETFNSYSVINKIRHNISPAANESEGVKGKSVFLKMSNILTTTTSDRRSIYQGDYVRNRFGSQYGGNTYESRKYTNYIPALCRLGTAIGDDVVEFISVNDLTAGQITVDVFGGDTYNQFYDYMRGLVLTTNRSGSYPNTLQHYITFPVESEFNLEYRRDELLKYYTEGSSSNPPYWIANTEENGIAQYPITYPEDATDLYLYNDAYSRENDVVTNTSDAGLSGSSSQFDTLILNSDKKFNGENIDSWTNFEYNNSLEVDSSYGPLNALKIYKNDLFFFQKNGFGQLAVLDRSVVTDNTGSPLSLGAGGVLERFDYISTDYGCIADEHILSTPTTLYFIDYTDKSLRVLSDNHNGDLGKIKGISNKVKTYLNSADNTKLFLGFNPVNKEVLFTLEDNTLLYSELSGEFVSRLSIDTTGNLDNYKVDRYTTSSGKLYSIYYFQDISDKVGLWEFDNETVVDPLGNYMEVKLLIHPNGNDIFTFDNLDIRSNAYDSLSDNVEDSFDIVDDTIHEITYRNSYITSPTIITNPGTANANINRLARAWRTKIPQVNSGRFVDSYIIANLRYNNITVPPSPLNKLVLHDVSTYVRPVNKVN